MTTVTAEMFPLKKSVHHVGCSQRHPPAHLEASAVWRGIQRGQAFHLHRGCVSSHQSSILASLLAQLCFQLFPLPLKTHIFQRRKTNSKCIYPVGPWEKKALLHTGTATAKPHCGCSNAWSPARSVNTRRWGEEAVNCNTVPVKISPLFSLSNWHTQIFQSILHG